MKDIHICTCIISSLHISVQAHSKQREEEGHDQQQTCIAQHQKKACKQLTVNTTDSVAGLVPGTQYASRSAYNVKLKVLNFCWQGEQYE